MVASEKDSHDSDFSDEWKTRKILIALMTSGGEEFRTIPFLWKQA
jgi:hypothetical protein